MKFKNIFILAVVFVAFFSFSFLIIPDITAAEMCIGDNVTCFLNDISCCNGSCTIRPGENSGRCNAIPPLAPSSSCIPDNSRCDVNGSPCCNGTCNEIGISGIMICGDTRDACSPEGITECRNSSDGNFDSLYFCENERWVKVNCGSAIKCGCQEPEEATVCSVSYCKQKGFGATNNAQCGGCFQGTVGLMGRLPTEDCEAQDKFCSCCSNYSTTPATGIVCGDGIINQSSEECDDGNLVGGDTCSPTCKHIVECGNGVKNVGEECDDGNLINGDSCSSACLREATGQCSDCGKGFLNFCDRDKCRALGDCVPERRSGVFWTCNPGIQINFKVFDITKNEPAINMNIIADKIGSTTEDSCTTNIDGICSMLLLSGQYNAVVNDLRFAQYRVSARTGTYTVPIEQKFDVADRPFQVALNLVHTRCIDTDPNNDPYIQGQISTPILSVKDYCVWDELYGHKLYQYNCVNNLPLLGSPDNCAVGCENGACMLSEDQKTKAKIIVNLKDESGQVISGIKVILSSGIGSCLTEHDGSCFIEKVNPGNYVLSVRDVFYSCLSEFGCPKSFIASVGNNQISLTLRKIPLQMEACSDTDGGMNYYKKGAAKDNKSGGVGLTIIDYCFRDKITLKESYCAGNNFARNTEYTCPGKCEDGACIGEEPEPITCTDTDGGINFLQVGTAVDATGNYTDYCQGDYIEEYYCESDEKIGKIAKRCADDSCVDGVCIKEKPVLCLDTDTTNEFPKGQNFYRTGTASDAGGSYEDSCTIDGAHLKEFYCSDDYEVSVAIKECINNSCSMGICLDGLVDYSPVEGDIVAPIEDDTDLSKEDDTDDTDLSKEDDVVVGISPNEGGTVSLGGIVSLEIPPGAITENAEFTIDSYTADQAIKNDISLSAGAEREILGNIIYDFTARSSVTAEKITNFNENIKITIYYTDNDVAGLEEKSIVIRRYDGEGWIALPTTVDIENNTATAYTNHFTNVVADIGAFTGNIEIGIDGVGGDGTSDTSTDVFEALIIRIMNFLFMIGLFLVPVLVVIGGFMYMTAAGDPTRIGQAKKLILWSLIGFGVILFGKIILAILKYILQVK